MREPAELVQKIVGLRGLIEHSLQSWGPSTAWASSFVTEVQTRLITLSTEYLDRDRFDRLNANLEFALMVARDEPEVLRAYLFCTARELSWVANSLVRAMEREGAGKGER